MKLILRGPIVSTASQVVGLLQLALILGVFGASNATDAYLYLFSLSTIPVAVFLSGLMLPTLLNENRMTKRGLARLRWITPTTSLILVTGGTAWLAVVGKLELQLMPMVLAIAVNGIIQALAWFRAVAAAAEGDALWISGVALPANVLAALLLLLPWPNQENALVAMVFGLVAGNLVILLRMRHLGIGQKALASAPSKASARGSFWFLGQASASYAGQAALLSVAAILPATGLTYINVAYKVVASATTTLVNALMPHFVNQSSSSPKSGRRFTRIVLPMVVCLGAVLAIMVNLVNPDLSVPAVVVGIWLVTSTNAAIATRMSYKFLPANASRISIFVMAIVASLAISSTGLQGFSLTIVLAAFAAMDAGTASVLFWLLRDRFLSLLMATSFVAVATIGALSLV
jgi:hypothetical protein